jgi:mannopine transport system permease protein
LTRSSSVKAHSMFASPSARQYGPALSVALLSPVLVLIAFAFLYPLSRLMLGSVFAPEFTLEHYRLIIEEPLYLAVLWRTFKIALIVTIGAFVLGYPVAYAMARLKGRIATVIAACVLIPLWTSALVRSYAWITLLQRKGVVNTALGEVGLVEAPLKLLYTEGAVIVAMTHVLLPFMILPIFSVLRAIPDDYVRAARNLGSGAIAAFVKITLPLSLPGVAAGTLITFILALGFYITPALVGGPGTLMISILIGQQTTELLNWPFAGALSVVLLVATLIVVVAFRRVLSLSKGFQLA